MTEQMNPLYPMTKKELAVLYKYHPNTISKMCKQIGLCFRRRLRIPEVEKFIKEFGAPKLYQL